MIAGVFDEFFGVPTHPLAVHAPVVLVPLLTIAAVVLVARSSWRRKVSWLMPTIVFVMAALLWVATESGEAVVASSNVFGDITEHKKLGERTFQLSVVWFVIALVSTVIDRASSGPDGGDDLAMAGDQPIAAAPKVPAAAATGIAALAALVAVLTTVWLIRTGHAGAESRWVF